MNINIIVAKSRNNVIGDGEKIPWHISEDMIRFRNITMGFPVVMGRKTFESFRFFSKEGVPKPLSGRTNIVISSSLKEDTYSDILVVREASKLINFVRDKLKSDKLFIIGGESIYREFLPITDTLYLTEIEGDVDGDKFFPELDLDQWLTESEETRKLQFGSFSLSWKYLKLVRK